IRLESSSARRVSVVGQRADTAILCTSPQFCPITRTRRANMKNAITTYLLMFVASIVGLWLILHLGSRLQAPPALEGTWLLHPQSSLQEPLTATIEQSGRFVRISFNGGPFIEYRLE